MRTLILTSAATAAIALSACDQALVPTVAGIAPATAVGGIPFDTTQLVITPGQVAIPVNTTIQLTSNFPDVVWRSTDPSIATVSATGLVTGIRLGSTIITAQLSNDPTRFAAVTVQVLAATNTGSP